MEKNLTYLTSKIWYRLIKVIFIIFFSFAFVISNYIVFSEVDFSELSRGGTEVTCTYGTKEKFSLDKVNSTLSLSDFPNNKFEYPRLFDTPFGIEVLGKCLQPKEGLDKYSGDIAYTVQLVAEFAGGDIYTERLRSNKSLKDLIPEDKYTYLQNEVRKIEGLSIVDKLKNPYPFKFDVHLFEVNPSVTHLPFLKVLLLTNVAIVIILEVIRRSFYYVVLGTLRPKK